MNPADKKIFDSATKLESLTLINPTFDIAKLLPLTEEKFRQWANTAYIYFGFFDLEPYVSFEDAHPNPKTRTEWTNLVKTTINRGFNYGLSTSVLADTEMMWIMEKKASKELLQGKITSIDAEIKTIVSAPDFQVYRPAQMTDRARRLKDANWASKTQDLTSLEQALQEGMCVFKFEPLESICRKIGIAIARKKLCEKYIAGDTSTNESDKWKEGADDWKKDFKNYTGDELGKIEFVKARISFASAQLSTATAAIPRDQKVVDYWSGYLAAVNSEDEKIRGDVLESLTDSEWWSKYGLWVVVLGGAGIGLAYAAYKLYMQWT